MKSPASIFVALVLVVLFSLVAYRVSVHFATLPDPAPPPAQATGAPAGDTTQAPVDASPPALPPAQAEAHEAIDRSQAVRDAVEAYARERGDWPQSLAQLGLGVPGAHAGGPVAGVMVQQQGVVVVLVKPHVARGGTIQLSPRRQADGAIEWRCRASNYPAATRLPDCR